MAVIPARLLRFIAAAALSTACVKGEGDPCQRHDDCEEGLACVSGSCVTCGDGVACLPVQLLVATCDAQHSPTAGVQSLRVTVTGEGIGQPLVQTVPFSDRKASLSAVPFGKRRQISVEGLSADESLPPVSRGASVPLDLSPESAPEPVTIFLRPVDRFTGTSGRLATGICSNLASPRAGHSASLLPDGSVLLAGGYTVASDGTKSFLKSLELYRPESGAFSALSTTLFVARGGHTATTLPDGRILIVGGDTLVNGQAMPATIAELFDPSSMTISQVQMAKGRTRHAAVLLPGGRVLVTGGITLTKSRPEEFNPRYPSDTAAIFDPDKGLFEEVPLTMGSKRADHAAALLDSSRVALIGGTDGNAPLKTIDIVTFRGELLREPVSGYALSQARAKPVAMRFDGPDGRIGLFVGGAASGATSDDGWEWLAADPGNAITIDAAGRSVAQREGGCAAVVRGQLVFVGGRASENGTPLATADRIAFDGAGLATASPTPDITGPGRIGASCTALSDGTLLVTGGETIVGSAHRTLDDAVVFQPR